MRRLADSRGFTLVELVIAMPMLAIVLGGLTVVMLQMNSSSRKQQELATLQTEARSALELMETDVREGFAGDGTGPIRTATATSIEVWSPDNYPLSVSGGTLSSFHDRDITYTVSSGSLTKTIKTSTNTYPNLSSPPWAWGTSSTTTLLGSISNTDIFTYYTSAGIQANPDVPLTFPISSPYGIVAVGIKLTLTYKGPNPTSFTITGLVSMRDPYG
ncbi:MAG: prepilin-type N-terminal cleavage/methylation domain-containing protein [Actinomycetota bacterium]